jgi:predicted 2-oxoglutarate/Fe(II)-dependent dioxygenase YbiX
VCLRRLPADVTAHMYLNEDFEGGDFFFTDSESGTNREVFQATCGRVLAYSSGYENMHGVTAVKSGKRCHITLWLSQDERKKEELFLEPTSPFLAARKHGIGRAAPKDDL